MERVNVRFHKAIVQAEADVSLPHVVVENDGDTKWISRELAFRLIQIGRVEEVDDDTEEPETVEPSPLPALTWPEPSKSNASSPGSWPVAPVAFVPPETLAEVETPEDGVSDANVANPAEETPAPKRDVLT